MNADPVVMSASATATAGGTPVVSDVRLIAISVSDAVPVAPQRNTMPKRSIALEKLPSKKYLTAPSVLSGSRFAKSSEKVSRDHHQFECNEERHKIRRRSKKDGSAERE